MTVSLSPIGNAAQFFSATGAPLNAGQLFTYAAGTSTPQATYTSNTGGTSNANPIILAADGRLPAEVWLTDGLAYKFVLKDSLSNILGTYDNLSGMVSANSGIFTSVPIYVASVGGSGNALVLTPTNPISAYAAGQIFTFSMAAITSNTGGATVAVSGLSAQTLYSKAGAVLTGDELRTNGIYMIEYSSAISGFVLVNSDQPQAQALTFTPGIAFGGASVGVTYGTRVGQYFKLGNIVFFFFQITLTSKGSSVGIATITGLPYAVNSGYVSDNAPTGVVTLSQVTFADKYVTLTPIAASTTFHLASTPTVTGGPNFLTDAALVNTSAIFASGFYFV